MGCPAEVPQQTSQAIENETEVKTTRKPTKPNHSRMIVVAANSADNFDALLPTTPSPTTDTTPTTLDMTEQTLVVEIKPKAKTQVRDKPHVNITSTPNAEPIAEPIVVGVKTQKINKMKR